MLFAMDVVVKGTAMFVVYLSVYMSRDLCDRSEISFSYDYDFPKLATYTAEINIILSKFCNQLAIMYLYFLAKAI